uniref:Uncharacterized protein n=1 Tax=mine drainage metagenome TaxID=410659 RepID=E6QR61_9ZZZZ
MSCIRDGCKAQSAANGCSIRKLCNAADARIHGNPSGWGRFGRIPVLRSVFCERHNCTSRALGCIPKRPQRKSKLFINKPLFPVFIQKVAKLHYSTHKSWLQKISKNRLVYAKLGPTILPEKQAGRLNLFAQIYAGSKPEMRYSDKNTE